jgi:hypothetical protein
MGSLNSIPAETRKFKESSYVSTDPEWSFVIENESNLKTKEEPSKKRKANERNLS